ncbi:hypothetical protein ColKHC_02994 [Colletotrichum higginsianum]|nr:hypothetical protein ColKHC_02994 [Colletotrichum higginsianum]
MAFSVHRSSTGKLFSCQLRRSSAVERYSVTGLCDLNKTPESCSWCSQSSIIDLRKAKKAAATSTSPTRVLICVSKDLLPSSQRTLSDDRLSRSLTLLSTLNWTLDISDLIAWVSLMSAAYSVLYWAMLDSRLLMVFSTALASALSLLLELVDLVSERADSVQDLRVRDLCLHPLHQRTAGLAGTVDLVEGELGRLGHLALVVEVDDAGNEIVATDDTLDHPPVVDLVAQQSADGLEGQSDTLGRVTHGTDFGQVLALDVANTGPGLFDGGLGLGEVLQHHLSSCGHLGLLLLQGNLDLQGGVLSLFGLSLVRNHALQLLVGLGVLLLELGLLLRKADSQVANLVDRVSQLLETDIEMALLFLQILALLVVELDVLRDEIQEVSGGEEGDLALLLEQLGVESLKGVVDVDHGVDDGLAVRGGQAEAAVRDRDGIRRLEVGAVQVHRLGEFVADLEEGLIGPVAEPVEHATVEQGGTGRGLGSETAFWRVHREHDVQVLDNLLSEPFVEFLGRVQVQVLSLGTLLASRHERGELVSLEKTRNLGVGEQSVHPLEETRVENIGLVHDEADLLSLATTATEDIPEIVIKVFGGVLAMNLDLEDLEAVHPCHEARKRRLSTAADTDENKMALRLSENTVDPQDVFQDIVEQNERHVNLFLAEGLESGLDEVSELLPVDRYVVLRQPVREEDGAAESLLVINSGEELKGDPSDGVIGPLAFILSDETILEESQRFVRPDADESLDGKGLQRPDGLVDTSHPSGKLTRTVHVVRLDLGREALLRLEIELDHGLGQRFRVAAERRDNLENGRVESTVDLQQGELSGVIDHDERSVTEEPSTKGRTACIGGRVASTDELDTVEGDPGLVRCSPETVVLDELTQEGDGSLRSVFVGRGQVDFVAENDQPSADLGRREHYSVQGLLVLAVLLKGLDQEIRRRCAGEVETDNLHVGKLAESAEQRHRLTRTGRTAKKQRLVLGQPGVQDILVTHGIQRRNDHVGLRDRVGVDLDGRHLVLPRRPLGLGESDVEVNERASAVERRVAEAGKAADSISKRLAVV